MTISVIVPFYNAERFIETCRRHLLAQDYPEGGGGEIIMVDNNSSNRSAEIVRHYPLVVLLDELKQGTYTARNRGLAAARHDITALTDPDCAPAPDWLATTERSLRHAETDILVGSHQPGDEVFFLSLMSGSMEERIGFVFSSKIRKIYYAYTNNMAVRRELFEELGSFPERRRGGDTLFVQSYLDGHPCSGIRFVSELRVPHLEIDKLRTLCRKFFLYAQSRKQCRHIANVRALTNQERLMIFRAAIRRGGYNLSQTIITFILTHGWRRILEVGRRADAGTDRTRIRPNVSFHGRSEYRPQGLRPTPLKTARLRYVPD